MQENQKKILVVSLNPAVDKIVFLPTLNVGGINRVATEQIVVSAGGKGVNVARMCAQFGESVTCIGFAAGEAGRFIANDLSSRGAEVDFVWLEGETRTNLNIISETSETEILEEGPSADESSFDALSAKFEAHLKNASVVVLAGGLPRGLDDNTYAKMISHAKSLGIPTILDASGAALKEGIKAGPTLVKPNLRELIGLLGEPTQISDVEETVPKIRKLMSENSVGIIVVSKGVAGATLISGDAEISAPAMNVEIINTIGCGDAMVAGLACGIKKGDLGEILRLGTAFAASNAGHKEVGFVDRVQILDFIISL